MIDIPYEFSGSVSYQRYADIVNRIRQFPRNSVIGQDESGAYDVYLIELGNPDKPTIFLTGSMHGTEWHGTQYSLAFMENLRDNTFPDRGFRDTLLNDFHIAYNPVMNPWGVDNNEDIYSQFNNPWRYNVNGVDLNGDFYDFNEQESRNIRDQIQKHQPFAYIDMHMFQPGYGAAYGRNMIFANAQPETADIRDTIADSWKVYAGQEVAVWTNTLSRTSGLARAYVGRQSNPYTPYTLSYISELVRPAIVNGSMVRKLTDSEIFKYGCANLYLFFRTSIDYFRKNMKAPSVPSRPSPKSDFHGLVVKDQDNRELGILDKAYNVSVKRTVNEVWTASFSLPRDDPKNELCSHFNYIDITSPSDRYMGLYRIMPAETRISASEESITYRCEHVLSTLLDDVMEGYHDFPGYNTEYVLQSILNLQEEKRWELGEVEFERFFHYSFENENGLLAPILSVPEAFDVPYEFTFDTTVFPWRLNLVRPDNEVKAEIRWGKDMIDFSEVSDPTNIVNYIIPKGAGEGVNQLTIEAVNDGERFLKDDASIREWGTKKYIWIDERFEDAESLKSNAQSLLNQWKIPKISFDVNTVDLSVLEEDNDHRYFIAHDQTIEGAKTIKALQRPLNGITRIIANDKEYEARILSEDIPDLLEQEYNVNYEINNKVDDLATSQTNIERKQQVNEAYSKGATNIMTFSYQDNCDSNIPAVIPFYIDDDVVNVNTLELTLRTKKFRAYSETTKGGGGTVTSTSSGGSSTQTSSSGGGTSRSTNSGGGSSQTSSAGGDHRHTMFVDTGNTGGGGTLREYRAAEGNRRIAIETSSGGDMMTAGSSGNHSHSVSIPNHSHDFSTPNHTHTVSIPAHRHQVDLPDHTHDVEHKIVELDETPSSLTIKVDGNTVDFNGTSGDRIDMIPYLDKNDNGKISRGRHEVEILPDSLARIEADLILRVFIRSHLGGKF